MNALKVRERLRKKEAEANMRKVVAREAEKFIQEHSDIEYERQKYNAMLHVFHLFVLLNREFGFGKVRLGRLWDALLDSGDEFKASLKDGIGFTKVFNEFDRMKFHPVPEETQKKLERYFQRLYEDGVKHSGDDYIGDTELSLRRMDEDAN